MPFSSNFGFDRGTPVDRYYLHNFLEKYQDYIIGDILEIQAQAYGQRFGHTIHQVDSVDINPAFEPTYLCDLAKAEGVIPASHYDCFLLPNTLQHLQDLQGCLVQALRVIKPGGVILASAAGFVPLIPDGPDYWRLSAAGWNEIVSRTWPGCEVSVESHGNCLAAVACMLGLALEELISEELDVVDTRYPVLVTLFCRKPLGN